MRITRAAENSTLKSTNPPALGKPGPRSLCAISVPSSLRCQAGSSGRLRPQIGEPGVELLLGDDVRRLAHRRVPEPAQLRADDGVVARAGGLDAVVGVDPRHGV